MAFQESILPELAESMAILIAAFATNKWRRHQEHNYRCHLKPIITYSCLLSILAVSDSLDKWDCRPGKTDRWSGVVMCAHPFRVNRVSWVACTGEAGRMLTASLIKLS